MAAKPAELYNPHCPSRDVLELVGSKWGLLIICTLRRRPTRTGDLMRGIGGISQKMLTQTLRGLQDNGFVERVSYHEVPPRVEYRLTALGKSLSVLSQAMENWVVAHYPAILEHRNRRSG